MDTESAVQGLIMMKIKMKRRRRKGKEKMRKRMTRITIASLVSGHSQCIRDPNNAPHP